MAWIGTLCLVFVATALTLQHCFFPVAYHSDDFDHLIGIHRVHFGGEPLARFIMTPHNEQFLPLWRLWYFVAWRVFGLDPTAWHLLITISHGLSAVFAYLLVERYAGRLGGLVTGFLWAGTTIGTFDSPLMWIAPSHFAIAIFFHLASLAANRLASGPHWPVWTIVMSLALAAGLFTMGSTLPIALLLPLQRYWVDGTRRRPKRENALWFAAWGAPIIGAIISQIVVVTPRIHYLVDLVGPPDWIKAFNIEFLVFIVSLEHLLPWPLLSAVGSYAALVGFLLLLAFSRLKGPALRFTVASFLVMALYTFAACAARTHYETDRILGWGRYRYAPSLWWILAIGTGAGCAWHLIGRRGRRAVAVFALIFLSGFLFQQSLQARSAADQLMQSRGASGSADPLFHFLSAIENLNRLAAANATTVTLPDIPLFNTDDIVLSQAADLGFPAGLANVRFKAARAVTVEERARTWALADALCSSERKILQSVLAVSR